MKIFSASDTRCRFGQLIDMAQPGPARIQRQGRDVAITISAEEFHCLADAGRGKVSPAVERLHAKIARRWESVCEALAKQVEYLALDPSLYLHAEQLRLFTPTPS